ncbi:arginine--tRNA ligase [Sodalis-like secondary symbiont of Drepanosiphum platanoidis]|uniref:arginine--tRNA ligase n=1 Tax=Sodalis-like secondary symbiont of Drepanosiphum platanoidis TaxID=2994493 RepID=UPI003464E541
MNIKKILLKKFILSLNKNNINIPSFIDIKLSKQNKFGDYQINSAISISKKLKISSMECAKKIVNTLDLKSIAYKIEIINPGFINIFLNKKWIEKKINISMKSKRFGIKIVKIPQNIIIDYSSPNAVKSMHVGHMRSTIIGDAIVKVLEFLGHKVIRANHIGDWGSQFGMILAYLFEKKKLKKNINNIIKKFIPNLEKLYISAKKKYIKDIDFVKKSKKYFLKLQNNDKECLNIWKKLISITINQNKKIYKRLNVSLTNNDIKGESFYKKLLPNIVSDLKLKKLAIEKNGSTIVVIDSLKNKIGKDMGVIIQKKDKTYLYITIDIACLKYRCEILKADRIIYYVDSRQNQHLNLSWKIARIAGYVSKSVLLEHHMFGMMLNKNKIPFKTRDGNVITLLSLLNEASERAYNFLSKKNIKINNKKLKYISEIVGIGTIKYSDLSKNRITNYIFDWNKILSFDGNTALYMQYAYARINSILKKSKLKKNNLINKIFLSSQEEINLAIKILQYEEVIYSMAKDGMPHFLCNYLYETSVIFSSFYENCPILNIKNKYLKLSRLSLSFLTSRILKHGLNILGIKTVKKI